MFPLFFAFVNKYIYFCTENSQVFNFRYSTPNNSKPASSLHASLLLNIKYQVTFVPIVHMSCIRPVPAVISVHYCSSLSSYIFPILPLYNNSTLYLRFVRSTNYLTYLRQLTLFFFSSNHYKCTYQHIMIRYPARCARPAITFCLSLNQ